MTPKYYHSPLKPASTRVRCPVCHQEVYSRAGIHPQCAVKQADPPKPKPPAKPTGEPVPAVTDPSAVLTLPVADSQALAFLG